MNSELHSWSQWPRIQLSLACLISWCQSFSKILFCFMIFHNVFKNYAEQLIFVHLVCCFHYHTISLPLLEQAGLRRFTTLYAILLMFLPIIPLFWLYIGFLVWDSNKRFFFFFFFCCKLSPSTQCCRKLLEWNYAGTFQLLNWKLLNFYLHSYVLIYVDHLSVIQCNFWLPIYCRNRAAVEL